ncbi:fimbrial protein [Serratia fonticola]|uniref:fimbrial protein n=1 Tax=Serratia fonticola TaxID=47917 RepID=UPI00192C7596|nr:fimbrial protein [Serratia fonticola]MBL5905351.1 fimbrial protein [Serratia fonticola]
MARYSCIFLLIALGGPVEAADNMSFSGMLIEPPPCTISDGGEVGVDFGSSVGVSKVDGVNYLQTVDYRITCTAGPGAWSMTLTVLGDSPDYDKAAIESSVDDLAIRLLQNGKPFILNQPIPIKLDAPPTLQAVPVKRPGATLRGRVFEATATLLAVYQ